jgi:hypothetical protein
VMILIFVMTTDRSSTSTVRKDPVNGQPQRSARLSGREPTLVVWEGTPRVTILSLLRQAIATRKTTPIFKNLLIARKVFVLRSRLPREPIPRLSHLQTSPLFCKV